MPKDAVCWHGNWYVPCDAPLDNWSKLSTELTQYRYHYRLIKFSNFRWQETLEWLSTSHSVEETVNNYRLTSLSYKV
jgi:hypothetical protein